MRLEIAYWSLPETEPDSITFVEEETSENTEVASEATETTENVAEESVSTPTVAESVNVVTEKADVIEEGKGFIEKLAGAEGITVQQEKTGIPDNAVSLAVPGIEIYIPPQ